MNRRGFLKLLGIAAPAAALAPQIAAELPVMLHPTGIPYADPPDPAGLVQPGPSMRYLGLAQLKVEGTPTAFDPPDEISRFAKDAFGRKELYLWPEFEKELDS
jgi:hypothetical protein